MSLAIFERFDNGTNTADINLRKVATSLALWSVIGAILIAIFAMSTLDVGRWYIHNAKSALEVFGFGSLLSLAAIAIGGLLGFLFGIPRTIQSDNKAQDEFRQVVNTNLEQISDWLTKILVGVGLTELNNLAPKMWALADSLKTGLNNNQAITECIIVNFLVCGFFAGYLLTRLFLAGAFTTAARMDSLLTKANQVSQQFTAAGQYKKAIETLEIGLRGINETTPKDQKRSIYENLTYNYLYQDPPEGFTKVIQLGKQYIDDETDPPSPKIWANLALAYGQQYRWESGHDATNDQLKSIRDSALDAVRQSLKLEPRMRSLLRMVWDPDDPTKISAEENDLEAFHDDAEFRSELQDQTVKTTS